MPFLTVAMDRSFSFISVISQFSIACASSDFAYKTLVQYIVAHATLGVGAKVAELGTQR